MSNWNIEEDEAYQPPWWLVQALRVSGPADSADELSAAALPEAEPAFALRCREAADAALGLSRLRAERQRVGFVPLPFADYIAGLVKLAGVPMRPVLTWLGVETLTGFDSGSLAAYARLARVVGMSLREAMLHLRMGFAALVGSAPVSLLAARRRQSGTPRNQLETSEATLREIEAGYGSHDLAELHRIESELNTAYAGTGGDRPS